MQNYSLSSGFCFRLPRRLIESAWVEHGPFALWLTSVLRPKVVVELGSYSGYSFCAFCEALEQVGEKGVAVAVDTWQGDEHSGFYDDQVYNELLEYTQKLYPESATLIRGTFDQALPSFTDGSIDLLHVDGRHRYEDVKHDFESYQGKLSDRAVVLFHDTQVRHGDFGVHAYWAELAQRYPSFEFYHGNGLGVLAFGKNAEALIPDLFQAGRESSVGDEVRAVYSRLGGALADRVALERTRAVIDEELSKIQAEARDLLKAIHDAQQSLSWKSTKMFRKDEGDRVQETIERWKGKLDGLFGSGLSNDIKLREGAPIVRSLAAVYRQMLESHSMSISGPLRVVESVLSKK